MEEATDIEIWERLLNEQTALFRRTASENVTLRSRVEELERELAVWKGAQKTADEERLALTRTVAKLERSMDSLKDDNPLVLCLIDGDGHIFLPELIKQGQVGGRTAAMMLTKGLTDYLARSQESDGNGFAGRGQVWLTVYCNMTGLSETLYSNQLATPESFEAFVTGFNQASPLFSIVDVGNGKEAADAKIKECLRVFTRFPQIAKVFFGGSHDNSYASTLHYLENEGLLEKITILRGYKDLARELKNLNLPIAEVDGVFMTKKIPSNPFKKASLPQPVQVEDFERFRTPSGNSPSSAASPSNRAASPTKNEAMYLDPTLLMSKHKPPPCNFFYLSECKSGVKCRFGHNYILSQKDLSDLRENARKTPCPNINRNRSCPGGEDCIHGHFCPRGKTCIFLKDGKCKFTGRDMHSRDAPRMPRNQRNISAATSTSATSTHPSTPTWQSPTSLLASPGKRDGRLPGSNDMSPPTSVMGGAGAMSPQTPLFWPYPTFVPRASQEKQYLQ